MHSDFEPVHLKEANVKLDKELVSLKQAKEENRHSEADSAQTSLWLKFVDALKKIF